MHDSKTFWPTVKPLLSGKDLTANQITLIENGEIISDDKEVSKTFGHFFKNAVRSLDITENRYLLTDSEDIDDPVDAAIKKFEIHPSSLMIKDRADNRNFSLYNILSGAFYLSIAILFFLSFQLLISA